MRLWSTALLLLMLVYSCKQEKEKPDLIPFINVDPFAVDSVLSEMTLDQKLGQLLFCELDSFPSSGKKNLIQEVAHGLLSGLLINKIEIDSFLLWRDSLRQLAPDGLWIATQEQLLINNQFSDAISLPSNASIQQIKGDSLQQFLEQLFTKQLTELGFNWAPLILSGNSSMLASEIRMLKNLSKQKILSPLCHLPGNAIHLEADSVKADPFILSAIHKLHEEGLPAIFLDTIFFSQLKIPPAFVQSFFRKQLGYNGLIFGDFGRGDGLADLIAAGVDVFWVKGKEPREAINALKEAMDAELLSVEEVNIKVKRVLQAKRWQKMDAMPLAAAVSVSHEASMMKATFFEEDVIQKEDTSDLKEIKTIEYFRDPFWENWREDVYLEAISLLSNPNHLIPFTYLYKRNFNIIHVGRTKLKTFDKTFGQYAGYTVRQLEPVGLDTLPALSSLGNNRTYVITIEGRDFNPKKDTAFVTSLKALRTSNKVALVFFGEPEKLAPFDTLLTIVQVPDLNSTTERLTAELLFGAIPSKGHLPKTINSFFKRGDGIEMPIVRLQYNSPSSVGISPEKLVGIDAIANTVIKQGIIPGCQVLVAKSGKIIYNKSFGTHTFSRRRYVQDNDLYDIASVTKVVGTSLAVMRLYDQGKFKLNSNLGELGVVDKDASISKIQVRKLLTHESGLQPFMPVIPYLLYRDEGNAACDSFFCRHPSEEYTIQVADSFYFKKTYIDSIWTAVEQLPLRRAGRFRYSDVNFMLLQRLVEKLSGKPLDEYLNEEFYHPLGLQHITYKPLEQFKLSQIIPTEEDERWRQRLVHGFVHDEAAALFGGVGGHAGLFSNANDLGVIGQLLLNRGSYGGRQFVNPNTVKLFSKAQYGTHRGLGFDTANPRSRSAFSRVIPQTSYGHTGFTGTCIWVDPEHEIVYVFLSNRLHPSAKNRTFLRKRVRERIQEVVYDALGPEQAAWPDIALLQKAIGKF